MESLPDDVLAKVLGMVARRDCKTAVEAVPLVCRRWQRVQKTLCGDVALDMRHIGCSLETVLQRFKSVTGLRLECIRYSTQDSDLTLIAKNCRSLTQLSLHECGEVTDAGVIAIAENCKSLTLLNLHNCWRVTDDGVIAIAENCKSLTTITLSNCDQVTDAGVIAIAENCKSLTILYLKHCEEVTDAGVIAIAENCKSLTYLFSRPRPMILKKRLRKHRHRITTYSQYVTLYMKYMALCYEGGLDV